MTHNGYKANLLQNARVVAEIGSMKKSGCGNLAGGAQ
jgi:hypothetical protein